MSQPERLSREQLMANLTKAKNVMNKVDSGQFKTGNVTLNTNLDGNQLLEAHQVQNQGQHIPTPTNEMNVAPKMTNGAPVYKNLETSKIPDHVKKVMLENPIPQAAMPNQTFSLEDVQNYGGPAPTAIPAAPRQTLSESIHHSNDTFTVSETVLRNIIKDVVKEELLDFMGETFTKNLTEQAIKRTINTLIKEGKIMTKKKMNG